MVKNKSVQLYHRKGRNLLLNRTQGMKLLGKKRFLVMLISRQVRSLETYCFLVNLWVLVINNIFIHPIHLEMTKLNFMYIVQWNYLVVL